jgi:hypothetical protein
VRRADRDHDRWIVEAQIRKEALEMIIGLARDGIIMKHDTMAIIDEANLLSRFIMNGRYSG